MTVEYALAAAEQDPLCTEGVAAPSYQRHFRGGAPRGHPRDGTRHVPQRLLEGATVCLLQPLLQPDEV
jgi:hypothetical protein